MTKYLVITGGSRGIGKAVIQRFMRDGWSAINLSRSNCDIDGVINFTVDLSDATWPNSNGAALASQLQQASQICLVLNG
jgi:3-oxoacyl-[acyl-carrier protein] reductase